MALTCSLLQTRQPAQQLGDRDHRPAREQDQDPRERRRHVVHLAGVRCHPDRAVRRVDPVVVRRPQPFESLLALTRREGRRERLDQLLARPTGVVRTSRGGHHHGLQRLEDRRGRPAGLYAEQVPHVAVEVDQRPHLLGRGLVAEQPQRQGGHRAAADLRHLLVGLADRQAPGLGVPLLVVADALADRDVHDPHLHGRGPAGTALLEERSRSGGVDPEPGGLQEAAQRVVAGVPTGERERHRHRTLGVDLQGDHARDAEQHRAPATPDRGPELDQVTVDPVGHGLELGEQLAHRLGRVGHRVDAVVERLLQHLATASCARSRRRTPRRRTAPRPGRPQRGPRTGPGPARRWGTGPCR